MCSVILALKMGVYGDNINPAALQLITGWFSERKTCVEVPVVLELGCSTGALGMKLKGDFRCKWYGVDLDSDSVHTASNRLDNVERLDLNSISCLELRGITHRVDLVVLVDVLEHVYEPYQLIRKIKLAHANADIICVLPNASCFQVMQKVVGQCFSYEDSGIFDKTHKTFFSLYSAKKFFLESNYNVREGAIFLVDPQMQALADKDHDYPFLLEMPGYRLEIKDRQQLLEYSSYGFGIICEPQTC